MGIIYISLAIMAFAAGSQARQCVRNGKYYDPGKTWADSSCRWRCTCYQGGRYRCMTLCYRLFTTRCSYDEITKYRKVNVLGSQCQCDEPYCVKKPKTTKRPDVCRHKGKFYDVGDTFIDSCKWRCKCNPGTRISCTSLCPTWTVTCSKSKVKKIKRVPVPGSDCVCTKPTCVPKPKPRCYYRSKGGQGKYYNAGESWVDPTCTWRCSCDNTGRYQCASLCSSSGSYLTCATHQIKELKQVDVPGSTCKCSKPVCVDDSSFVCRQDGRRYIYNQVFINNACTKRCRCGGYGRLSCAELCPPHYADCGPNQIEKEKKFDIAGSKCHCMRPVCVDKPKIRCYYHTTRRYYDAGESWIDPTCTQRCTCGPTRQYKCSYLCPLSSVRCGRHQIKKTIQEDVPGSSRCKCTKHVCVDKPKRKRVRRCYYYQDRKYYNAGESWIDSCKWRCTCDNTGRYQCDSLCASYSVTCASNKIKQMKQVAVPGSKTCKCSKPVCVDRKDIQSHDSRSRVSCASLCPPTNKRCGPNQTKKYKKVAIPGTRCQCNKPVCVDNQVYCNFRGERYRVGESFVDKSCRWSCDCNAGGIYNCLSACTYIRKRCPSWQVKMIRYVPVKNSKTCRCRVPYCSSRR